MTEAEDEDFGEVGESPESDFMPTSADSFDNFLIKMCSYGGAAAFAGISRTNYFQRHVIQKRILQIFIILLLLAWIVFAVVCKVALKFIAEELKKKSS